MTDGSSLVVGIDCGGSKTHAILADISEGSPRVLAEATTGPANIHAVGLTAMQQAISDAVHTTFAIADLPRLPVASLALCAAGLSSSQACDRVLTWLSKNQFANALHVTHDLDALHAAALQLRSHASEPLPIIALVAGTGSIAWGWTSTGIQHRCGGWGPLLGDEGSGYTLGRQLLSVVCQSADGRKNEPLLLDAILNTLNLSSASSLTEWVYAPKRSRADIAQLATVLFDYRHLSVSAQTIIHQGARDLAELVATIARQFSDSRYDLALAGGLLLGNSYYQSLMIASCDHFASPPNQVIRIPVPAMGAVYLATQRIS